MIDREVTARAKTTENEVASSPSFAFADTPSPSRGTPCRVMPDSGASRYFRTKIHVVRRTARPALKALANFVVQRRCFRVVFRPVYTLQALAINPHEAGA